MTEKPRVPTAGEMVAGKYRVVRVIGEGGMGVVVEAEHIRLRQRAAIKFLSPEMLENFEIVERFEREARAASEFNARNNPHVVRVTDVDATPDGLPYMVMELLSGTDLESYRVEKGTLPVSEVAEYLLQACHALAEAHAAGIVHRDLKPGNLFLTTVDDRIVVKVLDFGISKFTREEKKLTTAGAVMGTALYMSPEQVRAQTVDGRSDVWSIGVILYELLSGETPWTGPATKVAAGIVAEDAPDIRKRCEIPESLAVLIHRMLEKNVDERVQSIEAVITGLASHAPAEGLGREIAAQYTRRSSRGRTIPLASVPSIVAAEARTVAAERSTTGPTTMQARIAARSRRRITLVAVGAFVCIGLIGVALIRMWRDAQTTSAVAATSPPASTSAVPLVTVATTAPPASVEPPPAPKPPASAEPAPVKPAVAAPPAPPKPPVVTPPPPRPPASVAPAKSAPAKPTATVNPTFLP